MYTIAFIERLDETEVNVKICKMYLFIEICMTCCNNKGTCWFEINNNLLKSRYNTTVVSFYSTRLPICPFCSYINDTYQSYTIYFKTKSFLLRLSQNHWQIRNCATRPLLRPRAISATTKTTKWFGTTTASVKSRKETEDATFVEKLSKKCRSCITKYNFTCVLL